MADQQWKQSVQNVQANTAQYVKILDEKINRSVAEIQQNFEQNTSLCDQNRNEAQGIKNVFNGEWRRRELLYDDQLLELKGYGVEIRNGMEKEENVRALKLDEFHQKIKEVEQIMVNQLKQKADVVFVREELAKKLDKL